MRGVPHEAAVMAGLMLYGYVGHAVDLRISVDHDMLRPSGFFIAIAFIMSIEIGGVAWFAPPCSTWVWMSRSSTKRHKAGRGGALNATTMGADSNHAWSYASGGNESGWIQAGVYHRYGSVSAMASFKVRRRSTLHVYHPGFPRSGH